MLYNIYFQKYKIEELLHMTNLALVKEEAIKMRQGLTFEFNACTFTLR